MNISRTVPNQAVTVDRWSLSPRVSVLGVYTQGERALRLQARGLLNHTQGLRLAVTGDLRHSLVGLSALPTALELEGTLGRTEGRTEGGADGGRSTVGHSIKNNTPV